MPFAERSVKVIILTIKSRIISESSVFVFAAYLLTVLFVRHLLSGYEGSGYLAKMHLSLFVFALFSFVFYLLKQNRRDFQVCRMGVPVLRRGGAEWRM